jgi:site-specific recombinase XerC
VATALFWGLRLSKLPRLDLGSLDGREGKRRLKVIGKDAKVHFVPIETASRRCQRLPLDPQRRITPEGSSPLAREPGYPLLPVSAYRQPLCPRFTNANLPC